LAGVVPGVGVIEPPPGEASGQPEQDRGNDHDDRGRYQSSNSVRHMEIRSRWGWTVNLGSSADSKPALKMLQRVRATPVSVASAPAFPRVGRRRPAKASAAPAARSAFAALAGALAFPDL